MTVLGIEASGDLAALALADESGLLAELAFRHHLELARLLERRIEQLLSFAGLSARELGGIGVSLGPGSFTGLRLGVTAAKTMAYALGIPIAGVPTLRALAEEVMAAHEHRVYAVLPAGRSHLFAAEYESAEGAVVQVQAEALLTPEELGARLEGRSAAPVLVGDLGPHVATIAPTARYLPAPAPRAATIARLARERLQRGEGDPVHALAPRYVRLSTPEARLQEAVCPRS